MSTETIRYERDPSGLVTLTLDDPTQSTNTMRARFVDDYEAIAARLADERESITGILLTSAKETFFAGSDLNELIRARPEDTAELAAVANRVKAAMRTIETLGKPVVACIDGSALGGGLELALACHHRIVVDDPKTRLGLPEVTLGLLPGAGGVVRVTRMLGVVDGLLAVLLEGRGLRVADALASGIVDRVVPDAQTMQREARMWVAHHPESRQPWDADGYRIPGGSPSQPAFAARAPVIAATLKKRSRGAHYDAPHHIMAAAFEGAQVDVESAFAIETRYFVDLACNSQQAKNMIQAFFFDLQEITKGGSRPGGCERRPAARVAVLGAGMMGAGIAFQCAKSGLDVVVTDTASERAEQAQAHARKLVARAVERGTSTQGQADELLARITTSADHADFAGCDLVIEAVFESAELKQELFRSVEPVVAPDALLASNTSTIPITELATSVVRQDDFVGLHFFSPVDRMRLVEVIRGERTSDAALARAVDIVLQIGKIPIVVNDARGFFTSRVIGAFLDEAVAALGEGIHPVMIERAGEAAGYPTAPLQLLDELTLTLPRKIRGEARAALAAKGRSVPPHPAEAVIDRLIDDFGREGRSSGKGFYDYEENGARMGLWSGLVEHFGVDSAVRPQDGDARLHEDLQERMLFAEALETVKCFDEGVLNSFADANVGSILGIGFPSWTGGVAQYVDQYRGGTAGFVERCHELAESYGDRFLPTASLIAKAAAGEPLRPARTFESSAVAQ